MFLIYVNDINRHVHLGSCNIYADDTLIYCTGNKITELKYNIQKCVIDVHEWYESNKLVINTSKSDVMLLTTRQMLSNMRDTALNVFIWNNKLPQCNSIKYIGVDIDNVLSWNLQTDSISKKLVFIISRLSRLKPVLPSQMLMYIYTSIIQPKIDYAISIWGYTTAHNINKVQRLQNRAARILTGNFDYVNTRGIDLVKNLGFMNVTQRRDYFMIIMMFKSILTDKPSMVTDVTVINRINIGSDHRMVMGSITLNTRAERRKLLNKNTRTRVDTQMIGTKKNTFQLELKNRFTALEEHDDMDSLNKNMTEIIQQSAMSIAKQTKRQKKPKISSPTKALMKKRREMIENNTPRDHIEYVEICKTIKKKAREDIRKHNLGEIRETIEASKSLKKVRRTQNLGKNRMITLLDKHGKEIQEQDKIMERIEEFYSELYDSDQAVTIQTVPKEVPPIMAWEVEAALRKMKNGKEAGKDQVNIETLKAGDETIAKQLAKLYTKCITERRIPKTWKEANMVIFFKKGNRKDIKNYRPICLLSNMYKLFTKIITTRLEKKLDENQPREQAGFRSKYSTTDHIHAINQLKEKCREYNIPLCVAFVDYEKAFDSVQTQAILTSLQEQGIEDVYIEILKDIYTDSSVTVHLHKESEKIRIKRGVRQGDTISPKLFTATLESIFRRLNWEHKGVKIDGEFLSNLRFADDIFLCTETPQELQQMLQELSDESRRMGLKMNIAKTKVMVVDNTPININNVLIENVQGYVYLGQHYSLKEKNQDKEIQRRIMAGWAAYAKHRDIFKSNLAICLKRQVYNSCVLPAMTYGAETWTLTKQAQNKLAAAQTKMERSMLNITYKDRKTNIWVRERTKVIDIINTVRKMKWSWAGHINRLKDDRWTSRVTSWRPYDKKRRQGRPAKRWRDDLDKYWSDTIWQRKAQDRVVWRQHAEAFAQPRDTTAA